jgi:hypothetical protein
MSLIRPIRNDMNSAEFAVRKTREARAAVIHPLVTVERGAAASGLLTIGNDWTEHHYDGRFHLLDPRRQAAAGRRPCNSARRR